MSELDRRSLLGRSVLGAGAALAGMPACTAARADEATGAGDGAERWVIDDISAVADTESGKVMGYIRGGIRVFKGIPYGEVLTPQARWVRAGRVAPWAGKRSCRAYGPICPSPGIMPAKDEAALSYSDFVLTRPNEDCLRVNVWTPGLDNRKRQVLFYCHGGGYSSNALMALRYEAHNLARYGDVVVVTMNHRLNAFGFLDLTPHGARYADSANLGMLDIVDALKWVRANIANFGGDPAKVMIFGHSGGGGKVLALLAMPEAKGLFTKAVAHSPGPMPFATPDQSAALTASFLQMVGIAPGNLGALTKLSADNIMPAAAAIESRWGAARQRFDQWHKPANNGWRPVVDGRTVLYQPYDPTVPSDVPLMIGTTLHEFYGALDHPEYAVMKEPQARELARGFFGPVGDGVYDVYKDLFPKATPYELSAMSRATGRMRAYSMKTAQRRSALHAAPTYNYWFQWRADTFEGRSMSYHEIEMPLVFQNSDAVPPASGGTAQARALSHKLTDAWLAFAHVGNPNTRALPNWSPVTPAAVTSMVFNNDCHIDHSSDLAAIEMFWKDRFPKA